MDKPLECGRCCREDCAPCRAIDEHCNILMKAMCGNDCKCLCVLERPINSLPEDIDIFGDTFRLQCGSAIPKKIIGEIRKMKADLVKERIQYKTEKDKMTAKLTKAEKEVSTLKYTMEKLIAQLSLKGITIKL